MNHDKHEQSMRYNCRSSYSIVLILAIVGSHNAKIIEAIVVLNEDIICGSLWSKIIEDNVRGSSCVILLYNTCNTTRSKSMTSFSDMNQNWKNNVLFGIVALIQYPIFDTNFDSRYLKSLESHSIGDLVYYALVCGMNFLANYYSL